MSVLPYRLIGESERSTLESTLRGLVAAWGAHWIKSPPEFTLSLDNIEDFTVQEQASWKLFGTAPESWAAWDYSNPSVHRLLSLIFGVALGQYPKPTPLMQALMQECIQDFFGRISALDVASQINLSESSRLAGDIRRGPGSGMLKLTLGGGLPSQQIVFGGALVERIINSTGFKAPVAHAPASLIPRDKSLGHLTTRLEVMVGSVEISLQQLAELEVGDVIQLGTAMHEPLTARTQDKRIVAKVHLGVRGNQKAVQFIE
ncbi:FliM/FliN family flagellar motor switch protein [Pseudomethylobacillus aquaticus]|uniref:FliM/FliN family flagellar motor switch protein n=1 Tax=Pseudomethylobacillus aquaticus TaxID=2676064 RepID=A0A3N0UZC9_9PROT|nr:FliM/FliN family flagellar motor C-terminal domain-containing protein [Pseudomethylobacillus aquaticus]ROH85909.1 FliM/FliN family flagellar motor switch protein [Pseudomethylobacillus aquaticus]